VVQNNPLPTKASKLFIVTMELNLCQSSDHGIQTFSARNLVFVIQHFIQWGEFSMPFSGENSALREGVCIWWTGGTLDWNTKVTYSKSY